MKRRLHRTRRIKRAVHSLTALLGIVLLGWGRLSAQPMISLQPISSSGALGGEAGFFTEVSGEPSLSYQWLFNGTNLPGATSQTLILTNLMLAQAGPYSVMVANPQGGTTSSVVSLVYGYACFM